jgi:hypothetical protein
MAGAVGAAARGAIEAGERGGGRPQADSAVVQGVVWDHAAFPKAKAVGEGGAALRSWVLRSGYLRRFGGG